MKIGFSIAIIPLLLLCSCNDERKLTTSSREALAAYTEGVELLDKFYYAEAKSALERAIALDSTFAMASARLAILYQRSGNDAAASREIAEAVRKSAHATQREQLFIRMFNHDIHFRNTLAAAVADSLIMLYPKEAEVYVLRGKYYELSKRYDQALALYEKAMTMDTSYAPAVMSLGYAYSAQGQVEKAIEAMERYIRLAPDAADPRASFADILMRFGRYDEAFEQYSKSLELKPDYWYSINRLGDIYALRGQLNQADKQYDLGMTKMVMNDQTRATHLATEGMLNLQRGKYDEALRLGEQSLALDSTNFRAFFVQTMACIKLKKFSDAKEMLETIRSEIARRNLSESQFMLEFLVLRARFFNAQGQFEEALAACDSAMEYGSELTRASVYQEIAEIKLQQGDTDGSLDALEEALRYNPNYPQALLTLTKVYKATGDRQMTNEIGNRLLTLWKNADSDFQPLVELNTLIGKQLARASLPS
jgi:tetratricopeptide (TPR) repeat protein